MNFTDLYKFVLPYCSGCPDPIAIEKIRDAAIELCERTRINRVTVSMATVAGTPGYLVSAPSDLTNYMHYAIHSVSTDQGALADTRFDLWVNSTDYPVVSPDRAQEMIAEDPKVLIAFTQNDLWTASGYNSTIFLNPVPTVSDLSIRIVFVVKPAQLSTQIQDPVGFLAYQVIADGAVARLKGMTGESWHDPKGAIDYRDRFDTGCSRIAGQFSKGHSAAPLRARPR